LAGLLAHLTLFGLPVRLTGQWQKNKQSFLQRLTAAGTAPEFNPND